jgi:hypothetical protein
MRTCDETLARLYDEDCRQALARGLSLPADVAPHVASCGGCRALVDGLRVDLLALRSALAEEPSPASRAAALAAFAAACPPPARLDWRAAAVWGFSGASLAACGVLFAGPLLAAPWPAVLVLASAWLCVATELTRQGLEA